MKTFIKIQVSLFLIFFSIFANAAGKQRSSCDAFKQDFAKLYVALQQSLNYEGKDAFYVPGKGIILQAHAASKNGKYEGKLFENMLYEQYQNSLKKVGALLLKNGNHQNSNEVYSENDIVDFFKSIDPNFDLAANPDMNSFLDKLILKSKETYKDPKDNLKVLNENDKYLLAKLLIHAKDKICSVAKNNSKTKKNAQLSDLSKYPLNRLVTALKTAKMKGNEDIADIKDQASISGEKIKTSAIKLKENGDLDTIKVDEEKTIQSAVMDNLHAFEKWMGAHSSCVDFFKKSKGQFIQAGIQGCNYQKFLDSLNSNGVSDFEKILHFINANQKSRLKAETNLDPLKLEAYIDSAIKTTNLPSCEKIGDTYFVRNLKYNGKSFDPTQNNFECTAQGHKTNCNTSIQLISDDLGRGIRVVPKIKNVKFTIPNSNCNEDMSLADSDVVPNGNNSDGTTRDESGPDSTDDQINGSIVPNDLQLKEEEKICRINGNSFNRTGKTKDERCTPPIGEALKAEEKQCVDAGKTFNKDGKTKEERCPNNNSDEQSQLTLEQLKAEEKECSEAGGSFNKEGKSKEERCSKPNDSKPSDEQLKLEEKACTDIGGTFKKDGKTKEERCSKPIDGKPTDEQLKAEEKKCTDDGKTFNKDGKTPEERCKAKSDQDLQNEEKAACEKLGKVFDPNGEGPGERCKRKTDSNGKGKTGKGSNEEPADPFKDFLNSLGDQNGKTPQRFVPTQIPTRQMYVLPGLP